MSTKTMGKDTGFRLGHRFVKIFKWAVRKKSNPRRQSRPCHATKLVTSKFCRWISYLKHQVKGLCFSEYGSAYIRVGEEPTKTKPVRVPKGHLAVYIGEKEDDAHRVLVPIVYFNHPLFVGLLRQAENVYGFDHPGGIQIPCKISEFKNVQTQISATTNGKFWQRTYNRY